jgi:hypothetical protein
MTDKQLVQETSTLARKSSQPATLPDQQAVASVVNSSDDASLKATDPLNSEVEAQAKESPAEVARPIEIGGPRGLEPTRYGDWESKGRCSDF